MKKGKAFDFMLYYGNKIPTELLMRHIKLKSETSNRLRTSALLLACFAVPCAICFSYIGVRIAAVWREIAFDYGYVGAVFGIFLRAEEHRRAKRRGFVFLVEGFWKQLCGGFRILFSQSAFFPDAALPERGDARGPCVFDRAEDRPLRPDLWNPFERAAEKGARLRRTSVLESDLDCGIFCLLCADVV